MSKKQIRNIIFALTTSFAITSCAPKPVQQSYVIACDANGNPVLVTET